MDYVSDKFVPHVRRRRHVRYFNLGTSARFSGIWSLDRSRRERRYRFVARYPDQTLDYFAIHLTCAKMFAALGDGATAARLTLDQLIVVRIHVSQ